jgi:hypothetical protein
MALLGTMPDARFNHFPELYSACLRSIVTVPQDAWFIAAYRHGRIAGIFPMHFLDYRAGPFRPRILGTIEDGQMQSCDFVFPQTPGNQDLLDALVRWLRSQRVIAWDELRFRKVSEDSSLAYAAKASMPAAMIALRHDSSAHFPTTGTYEQVTQAVTSKYKSNLRRRNRIAEQTAPLRHELYSRGDELNSAFDQFIDIEASGWKGEVGTSSAIRCQPMLYAFYRALVSEFGAREACVISLLFHGEQPVAGQLCLRVARTLYILKVGFSEAHAIFAPGVLLLERMIHHACEDPQIDVLHLVNDPPWARFFKPRSIGVWSYCAPNWTARGLLVHAGLLAKRGWEARTHASSVDAPLSSAGAKLTADVDLAASPAAPARAPL